MAMSAKFLAMMLPTFFARVRPASTRAKPACMRNTRHPATINQRLASKAVLYSAGVSSWAVAGAAVTNTAPITPANPTRILRFRLRERRELQDPENVWLKWPFERNVVDTTLAFQWFGGRTVADATNTAFHRYSHNMKATQRLSDVNLNTEEKQRAVDGWFTATKQR